MTHVAQDSLLVTATQLRDALASEAPPVLFDVRWKLGSTEGESDYLNGHLPGAHFLDLEKELAATPNGLNGRHPLPELAALEATLRRHGVNDGDEIVVYDDMGAMSASRAWWLFRWAGIKAVKVLDGGLSAWIADGGEIIKTVPVDAAGRINLRAGQLNVIEVDDVAEFATEALLLDARAPERFRGDVEPIDPVAGHIPHAINAPTSENLAPDGRFLSALELEDRFRSLGVNGDTPVGVYCGSGVTAGHEVLALALAGFDAALYPGSWSEWCADPSRPVALGVA